MKNFIGGTKRKINLIHLLSLNKEFCTKAENESLNLDNFTSINKFDKSSLNKTSQLFLIREFIEGFISMNKDNLKEAEKYFQNLKNDLRRTHIASHPYSLIIRRLGLIKLQQNNIKEGIIEIENFYQYSYLEDRDIDYQYNAILDLLKIYL